MPVGVPTAMGFSLRLMGIVSVFNFDQCEMINTAAPLSVASSMSIKPKAVLIFD